MICKNCGANIRNRESYCPSCGMELMIPYSKSLKEKYIAGEYRDHPDDFIDKKNYVEQVNEYQPEKREDEYDQNYRYETHEEYEAPESGSSILLAIILFLVVALLFGFVIGIIIFSGALHSVPGFTNITGL